MLAAIFAAVTLAGPQPLMIDNPPQQSLVVRSLGAVIVRFDPDGFVQARGCDGRLRPVGALKDPPPKIRIENDGSIPGFVFHPQVEALDRDVFQRMMSAVGRSDWTGVAGSCLP
jgi:hypothetical protein